MSVYISLEWIEKIEFKKKKLAMWMAEVEKL